MSFSEHGDPAKTEPGRLVGVAARVADNVGWTQREIPASQRHLVLREHLRDRKTETRHSELSAYLHVIAGGGGSTELLAEYDEHVAPAS